MWVIIKEKPQLKNNVLYFAGEVDNEPFGLETVHAGDTVNFTEDNIIAIY